MQKELLVPASILIGCSIIGAGLYFGLKGQPQPVAPPAAIPGAGAGTGPAGPPSATVAITVPVPQQAPAMPAPVMPGLAGPAVPPEVQAAAERAATEALAAEKKSYFVPSCYKPAIEKQPQPPAAKYMVDMTFDPQGTQVTFGLNEDRSALRPDVAQCIRDRNLALKIPPQGYPVRVMLPLEFP